MRLAGLRAAGLVLVLAGSLACVPPPPAGWGAGIPDSRRAAALADVPPEARRALLPLSEIFYARIVARRFNSRATFEDPSVRQFFPNVAAYSDYYAALVDALDRAHVRYARPTRVDLLGIEPAQGMRIRLQLRFVGRNDVPLRFWSAVLDRSDEWEWRDGRWWIVPGKV